MSSGRTHLRVAAVSITTSLVLRPADRSTCRGRAWCRHCRHRAPDLQRIHRGGDIVHAQDHGATLRGDQVCRDRPGHPVLCHLATGQFADAALARQSGQHRHPQLQRLGDAIRARRKALGHSQEAFADVAGLDRGYMGGIERGGHNVTLLNLLKIVSKLEMTHAEFFSIFDLEGGDDASDAVPSRAKPKAARSSAGGRRH